ncbi:MAG TPA: conjugal transfer protein TraG [Thiotrichales bacterium]|nr:conjugal transfer protein TraG [Thiotrichales bacterium]
MWEVFTYGNGVMLTALFQAVSALTDTDDYLALIRLVFVVTALVAAFEIGWTGRFTPTGRLFGIIVLLNAAILTKADVQLTDRIDPANDTVIADVPAGLAVPLAYATAFGDWATQAFEAIFTLPNDLRFRTSGMLFSSRLMEASTQFNITDTVMANNLSEFAEGCIYYGIMAGWFSIDEVMTSGNIWNSLPPAAFGNAIFVEYTDPAVGNTIMEGCRDARVDIGNDWASATDQAASVFGQRLFPQYAEAEAKARLLSALPVSYQYMANIAQSAADTIRQNAMINTMKRSFTKLANNAGAPGIAQDFALAQAEAQQRTTYATLGALAGRMMSLFRNVLETLIYGIFPLAIVFIMISLMQGKALFTYLKLLFWLQLWPPMYAILNYAMTVYGANATTAAAMQAGGGAATLNMLTQTGIYSVNSDMSAMAGYLAWIIPMFSWALVSGSGFAASQMAASLGSVAQAAGSRAASEVSTGNLSLGNYSAYNGRMFQSNTAPLMSRGIGTQVDPNTGHSITSTAGGFQYRTGQSTTMPFSANLGTALKSSVSTSLSNAMQAVKTASSGFSATTASTYGNMSRLSQTADRTLSTGNSADTGTSAQYKSDYGRLNRILDNFDFGQGLSRQQKAAILASASLGFKVAGSGAAASMDIAGASISSEDWKKAMRYAKESNFQEAWSAAQQSGQKLSTELAQRTGDSSAKDISAGFQQQRAASANLQASMTQAQAWQQIANHLKENGGSGSMNATAALMRYGNQKLREQGAGITMEQLAAQSASTTGDAAAATARLQGIINSFVQSGEVAKLAGVNAAAGSSSVTNADAQNRAAVEQATANPSEMQAPGSGAIKADAAGKQATVRAMGADRGVPDRQDVEAMDAAVRGTAAKHLNENQEVIGNGRGQVEERGASIEKPVTEGVDPANQNHLGNAGVEFGGNVASTGVNSFQGMKDTLSDLLPGGDSNEAGDDGAHQRRSARHNRGTWANHLDN